MPDLKGQIRAIAKQEGRTLSNTIEMLLRSAVKTYLRRQSKSPRSQPEILDEQKKLLSSDELLAYRIAEIILESKLLGKGPGRQRKLTRFPSLEKKRQRA